MDVRGRAGENLGQVLELYQLGDFSSLVEFAIGQLLRKL